MKPAICIALLGLVSGTVGALQASPREAMDRGDDAWKRRGDGHEGARALPEPVGEAIAAFQSVLDEDPSNLEARWKLLRALYFQGEYVLEDREQKLELFQRSKALTDEGRETLARQAQLNEDPDGLPPQELAEIYADVPNAPQIYLWSAVHWGLWGRHRGKIAAAKEGVAKKIRNFAEVTILLDEVFDEAGGHRILGRLHAEAPKLPFFTGWVDRDTAISELRLAMQLAPHGLLTRLYLAEALLEYRPKQRQEAVELLRDLAQRTPDPASVVEELKVIEDARALLAELRD
jgi:tetratricopeptide (TPR) repeat protein